MSSFPQWQQVVTAADENTRPPVDWAAFESSIGLRLPADYRAYVDAYGVGCINHLYWVLHPLSEDMPNLQEQDPGPDEEEVFRTPPPLPLGIGQGRLMTCAVSDGGETLLYWDTTGDDPDRWPIVLGDCDGDGWLPFDLTLTGFLFELFTGRLPMTGFAEAGFIRDQILIQRHPRTPAAMARWATTRPIGGR